MVGCKRGSSEGREEEEEEEGSWGQEDKVSTRSDAMTHPSTDN